MARHVLEGCVPCSCIFFSTSLPPSRFLIPSAICSRSAFLCAAYAAPSRDPAASRVADYHPGNVTTKLNFERDHHQEHKCSFSIQASIHPSTQVSA